jgi:hypothetical protein
MESYRLDNRVVVVEDFREKGEWLKYMSL